MPERACWASAIGACGGGLTREHYATRSLFVDEYMTVSGVPHATPLTLHIDDLVVRSLCKTHNESLHPLDDAARDVLNSFRRLSELETTRSKNRATARLKAVRPLPLRFRVDGILFERWALKTALNCAVVFHKALGDWFLPAWVPEVVFGRRALPPEAGLAALHQVGDQISNAETFQVAFGKLPAEAHPTGVAITFRGGWRFLLTWDQPVASHFVATEIDGVVRRAEDSIVRHPVRFNFGRDGSLSLDFDWSGTAVRDDHVSALRDRYRSPRRK